MFVYRALLAAGLLFAVPALADPRVIEMTGHGEASAPPDQAEIEAGVDSRALTAHDAAAQNAATMTRVMASLAQMGIPASAVRTIRFRLDPDYQQAPDGIARVFKGYIASNAISVTVDDVKRAGPVLDAMIEAGANRSEEIEFGLRDPQPLFVKARTLAAQDARARAEAYARTLGLSLGPVLSVKEAGGLRFGVSNAVNDGDATPLNPGVRFVEADLTVVWALK